MQKIIALFCVVLAGYFLYSGYFLLAFIVTIFTIGLLQTTKKSEVLDFENIYSKGKDKNSSDSIR